MDWDEHQVGNWLKDTGISEEYVAAFVGSKIRGKDLRQVISDEDTLTGQSSLMLFGDNAPSHYIDSDLIENKFWRRTLMKKISALISLILQL
jgi:hypothetical protein